MLRNAYHHFLAGKNPEPAAAKKAPSEEEKEKIREERVKASYQAFLTEHGVTQTRMERLEDPIKELNRLFPDSFDQGVRDGFFPPTHYRDENGKLQINHTAAFFPIRKENVCICDNKEKIYEQVKHVGYVEKKPADVVVDENNITKSMSM